MHNIDSVELTRDSSEAAVLKAVIFGLEALVGGHDLNSSVEIIALSLATWDTDAPIRRPVPHSFAFTVSRHGLEVCHSVEAIVLESGKAVLVIHFKRISVGLSLVNQAESGATVLPVYFTLFA